MCYGRTKNCFPIKQLQYERLKTQLQTYQFTSRNLPEKQHTHAHTLIQS